MIEQRQIFSTEIVQGLQQANQPSFSNPYLTASDADAGGTTGNYGSFYDTTDQAFLAATATPVTLNTTYLFDGITIGAPTSRIVMGNYGIYNVQFSAQLFNNSGAIQVVTFWIRKNGIDIPDSAKEVTLPIGAANYTADWGWLVECDVDDYVEVIFITPVVTVTLNATPPSAPSPAIPSISVVVTQGSKGVIGEIEEAEYKFFGAAPQTIASGGGNPQPLILSSITYPAKASVVDGRSRRIVYNIVVSKTSSPSGSVTVELTLGGLIIPVVISAGAGQYALDNIVVTIYMNFRAGNNIEAVVTVMRNISANNTVEEVSMRDFGTWDKTITNSVIHKFIRTSGNTSWEVEVKQITSELI